MSNLPTGWQEIPLNEISEIVMGQSPPSSSYNSEGRGLPFFQGKAEFQALYPRVVKFCDEPKKIAETGDILLSVRAPVGPTNLNKEKSCIGRGLAAIRPSQVTSSQYLLNYLRFIEPILSKQGTGSTFTAISKKDVEGIAVLLAPLDEQQRIVAKLDQLLAKVDACKERLDKIPAILKRFRQSVLAAACSGRLTADWRQADTKRADVERSSNNGNPFPVPVSWSWGFLADYIESMSNGIYKPEEFYNDTGVICLRMYNIQDGKVDWTKLKRMNLHENEIEKYSLKENDILINRVNSRELVGKAALMPHLTEPVIFESKNIRMRLKRERITAAYVNYLFMTKLVRDIFEESAKQTVGMATISQPQIRRILVPLPPIDEQHEIVRRVEALFKLADDIEKRYEKARAHVDRLTQSILAKAFRGELVPQDPGDEPASELLKRIRQEKASKDEKGGVRSRRTRQD